MPRRRLGVVLLVPPPHNREIEGLRRASADPMLGRVDPHLTLVPPVNVREDDLAAVLALVRTAAAAVAAPLRLTLGPATSFAPVTPTLYLEVGGELDRLRALRDAVFAGPLHRRLDHEFVPHVTLAQEQPDEARLAAGLVALAAYRVEVALDRVHVLEEVPGAGPDGQRAWVPLADGPLGTPAVVGRGAMEVTLAVHDTVEPEVAALELAPPGRLGGAGRCVVARRDGALLGAVVVRAGGDEALVSGPSVVATERRTGVGRHLVERAVLVAREAGARWVAAEPGALDPWFETLGWHGPDERSPARRWWRRL